MALVVVLVNATEEDLYKILGVSRKATTKEIKQAYRRKALDTHPDKNKNVPPEQAAEAFHRVVHAFEVLSDDQSRRQYDRGGHNWSSSQQHQRRQQQQQRYQSQFRNFQWNFHRRAQRLKDKFEVKEAQSRVMHIVSLDQLRTVMLDDNDRLERNLLMCFVTPQAIETLVDDEMVFPYPFAAMSSQGIWWEDLLQTVKVRYHRRNDLTDYFGIPQGSELTQPIFLFGKRGQQLSSSSSSSSTYDGLARFQTTNRQALESWVWKQLAVAVTFVNRHDYPVEVYWIHQTTAKRTSLLQPGEAQEHNTMLSHEFYVRDARVDTRKDSPGRYKLTPNSSLASFKILSDAPNQVLTIPRKTCFDLSGHCYFWNHQNECRKNPVFMAEACRKTCNLCTDQEDNEENEDKSRNPHDEL